MRPGVDELFHSLADLSHEEQAARLADTPRGAETIRELKELLAHDGAPGDPLAPCISAAATLAVRAFEPVGARCGPFRLVSVVGRGGMGVVYFAERADGEVRQRAAVKLLHPGWTNMHRQRFLHEREVLAALSHPNIARLLDAGHMEDGQPYLAMEYVHGERIDRYSERLPLRRRIELFLKVCAAVAYLHRNQLVHRDLKPGNILVDADGEPKLLDFGISKALDLNGDATATRFRMLTPDYASPEQVTGGPVGPASDIYSLGVMLRGIAGQDLRGDLEVIVRAATRPEPESRYASVDRLAADLQSVLDSRPIHARKQDWIYRARKLAARRPAAVLLGAAIAAIGLGVAWRQSHAARPSLMAKRVTANTSELPVHSAAISPDGKWIAYTDALGIHLRDEVNGTTRLLPHTADHAIAHWMPDSSAIVANVQHGASMDAVTVSLSGSITRVAAVWLRSPDGKRRAISPSGVQRIVVENANGSASRELWKVTADRTLNDFAWNPNSRDLAVISSAGSASTLEILDVETGRRSALIPDEHKLWIGGIAWTSPSRIVFSTVERLRANSYQSNLWEARLNARGGLATGGLRPLTAWNDLPILPGSLTTDGSRLVFVRNFSQRDVYVAKVDTSGRRMESPRRLTLDLGDDYPTAWTRDNKSVILTSDRTGELRIFRQDVDSREAQPFVDSPGRQILPRMAPDGQSVLFCEIVPKQGACRLMRAPLGGSKPQLIETIPSIANFRCSPAGPCVLTEFLPGNKGRMISELHLDKGRGREIYREYDVFAGTPDISPDGKSLATASKTNIVVRSFATGAVIRQIRVHGVNQIITLDYAPDGKGFYAGETRPTEVRQLHIDLTGRVATLWRQPGKSMIWGVPSPNGRNLALLMYTTDANVYVVDGI